MDNDSKSPGTKTPPQPKPKPTRHRHRHLQPPTAAVFYRECLKNHAAGIGGLAMDGCGEFLISPSATLSDPSSLRCAACGCHRNFHRRWLQDPKSDDDQKKGSNPFGRKRYRSKFSETQKLKMRAFAEKLGWRMKRSDERAVEEFCNEVGVSRGVLKVWIHNNKLSTVKNTDLHRNPQNGSSSSS